MKKKLKKFIPIIILAILTFIYFFNVITAKNFLWEDFPIYYFPAKSYVFNSLKNGQIPLWNPNLNSGYPIIADTSAAVFYPLNWLVIPFVSGDVTTDYWLIEIWSIFHLFLAGVFMYYLVDYLTQKHKKEEKELSSKTLELSSFSSSTINFAALISATTFMFSGFFIGHLKHVAQINTAAWFPLIFLFLYKSFKEKKYSNAIYAGIFWGISLLGGHLQIAYHFSFFLGLYILWEIIYNFINKKSYKKIIIASIISITIAIGLSAIQTFPFLEFLNNSTRQKVSSEFASSFSMPPGEFITNLFLPHTFGGYKQHLFYWGKGGAFWETAVYIGLLTLLLAIITIIKKWRENNFIFFLLFASLFSLSLAFGGYFFIHPMLLNVLPGLNMIRAPVRFMLPVIFAISILAGFGFNYFIEFFKKITKKEEQNKRLISNLINFTKFLLVIIGGVLFFILLYLINKPAINSGLSNNLITLNIVILTITLLIYLFLKKKLNLKTFATSLVFVLFVDLFIFGYQFNNGNTKPQDYYPQDKTIKFLQQPDTVSLRIIDDNYYMPNSAYIYNIPILGSNHYMIIKSYYDFTEKLAENLFYWGQYRDFTELFNNKKTLNLLGINYIISKRDFTQWFSQSDIDDNLYQNTDAYPRFILSKKAIVKPNNSQTLKLLQNDEYNPYEFIYINETQESPNGRLPLGNNELDSTSQSPLSGGDLGVGNTIKIINYEPEKIKLEIENNENNWLLANEIYYPGWQAKIDDKPIKIYQANYTFRAIQIPKGKHTVEFTFKPKSFIIGKIISSITLLILIILGSANLVKKRIRKH